MAWHDDESFWEAFEPALFDEQRWANAPAEVDGVLRLGEVPAGARVLDLCCGPGRHSLELARRGFEVTGVDRTQRYLDRAGRTASNEGIPLRLLRQDMRRYADPDAYDLVLNLYTFFSYFDDPDDELRVLRNIHTSLRPGGKLVMELMGKEVLARIYQQRDWRELSDGSLMLEERRVLDDWERIENRWILQRPDGTRHEHRFAIRLYGAGELQRKLAEAGLGGASRLRQPGRCAVRPSGQTVGGRRNQAVAAPRPRGP